MRFDRWHKLTRTFRFRLAVHHMLLVLVALAITFIISLWVVKSFATMESKKSLSDALGHAQELYLGENLPHGIRQLPEELLQRLEEKFPNLHIGHVDNESNPEGKVYEIVGSTIEAHLEIFAEPNGRIWVAKREALSEVFQELQTVIRKNSDRNLSPFIFSKEGVLLAGENPTAPPSTQLLKETLQQIRLSHSPTFKNNGIVWIGAVPLYDGNILCLIDSFNKVTEITRLWSVFFVVLTLIFLPMSGWIGFHLSRRAMAGVQRVSETANRIQAGNFTERVATGTEGYEIEKLASNFNDMLQRIETLMQELQEITTNIAHDLRTPIARIRGMIESLNWAERPPEDREQMAGKAIEECDRIIPLIDSILEIARADTQMLVLREEPFDLAHEVRTAHALFSGIADDRQIQFNCTAPNTLQMIGDRGRMQRVISNLIDNALKFTPSGGQVSISLEATDQQAILKIADNGPGIPPAEQDRVFERFYRMDRSRNAPGHGLGLSLVKAFVNAFGGTIKMDSSAGAGCTVTLAIPLSRLRRACSSGCYGTGFPIGGGG